MWHLRAVLDVICTRKALANRDGWQRMGHFASRRTVNDPLTEKAKRQEKIGWQYNSLHQFKEMGPTVDIARLPANVKALELTPRNTTPYINSKKWDQQLILQGFQLTLRPWS